jgi:hypothetical protein
MLLHFDLKRLVYLSVIIEQIIFSKTKDIL